MSAVAEEKYHELSEDGAAVVQAAIDKMYKPFNVAFKLLGNAKQKKLVDVTKVPDQYAFLMQTHVLVSVNESFMQAFEGEPELTEILI